MNTPTHAYKQAIMWQEESVERDLTAIQMVLWDAVQPRSACCQTSYPSNMREVCSWEIHSLHAETLCCALTKVTVPWRVSAMTIWARCRYWPAFLSFHSNHHGNPLTPAACSSTRSPPPSFTSSPSALHLSLCSALNISIFPRSLPKRKSTLWSLQAIKEKRFRCVKQLPSLSSPCSLCYFIACALLHLRTNTSPEEMRG